MGDLVKWGLSPMEQEDEVEWVRAQLSKTECECGNYSLRRICWSSDSFKEVMAGIIRGSTKVAVDIDEAEMQKRLRESRAKKAEKGAGNAPEMMMRVGWLTCWERGKPWRKLINMRREAPFGTEDIFAEGVDKVDFAGYASRRRRPLARCYVSMAKADKEIQRLKRRDEMAKSKMGGVGGYREKNALLLQRSLGQGGGGAERSKAEEVAAAESRRSSPSEPQRS
ncbi:hypothetical protein Prudu_699S000100 [Prunus dulcis]|uniref:Uncharacterized protein n=1 Tax=Prunus dulcis TaxID=3755 RepID=A0A5H2XZI7_PRUDU|nr:hypothetical protein Prudu_699S000100 [Prunus dulcis]